MKRINDEYNKAGGMNIDRSSIDYGSIPPLDMDFDDQSMISLKFLETPNDPMNRSLASPGRGIQSHLSVMDQSHDDLQDNKRNEYSSPEGKALRSYLSEQLQRSIPKNNKLLNTEAIEELTEENEGSRSGPKTGRTGTVTGTAMSFNLSMS